MERETQCRGMLHVFRLNLIPTQPEDNPLVHPSIRTYSAYITDIIILACCNVAPLPSSPSPERESGHCWHTARLPNQSPLRAEGGRQKREMGEEWEQVREQRGGGVTEAGRKSPALDG